MMARLKERSTALAHGVASIRAKAARWWHFALGACSMALLICAIGCQSERPLVLGTYPLYERDIPTPCPQRTITIERQYHGSPKGGPYYTGTATVRSADRVVLVWNLGILH